MLKKSFFLNNIFNRKFISFILLKRNNDYLIINNKKNNKKFYFLSNNYTFILFCFSYFFYHLSLEKCYEGESKCSKKVNWIKIKIIQECISCLISSILFILIALNKISKLHLIHFSFVFLTFYKYSHGIDFDDHGHYNFVGYFIIILFTIILLLLFIGLFYLRKKKIYLFIIFIIFILFILLYFIFVNKYIKCKDWAKGLNNTYIKNDIKEFGCQIKIPNECPYKIGKYFLDINKLKKINCKNSNKNAKKNLLRLSNSPYINSKTVRFGYPLMNKDPICLLDYKDEYKLREYFINNLVDMDNKTLNKILKENIPEIELDFSNNSYGKININVNYNKSLSKERKKLEKRVTPYSSNILILFIDSVSRAYSIRQLKKTLKFFEKFISYKGNYNKKFPSENFHSFQFFKYHSFKYYTAGNYPKIFYGDRIDKSNVLITKYLKKNGYVTCYSGDLCRKEPTITYHNLTLEEQYDHQCILCDPNKKHVYISKLNCLYGKNQAEYLYDYGNQFWRKYKDNRKFLIIITNDGHEGTLEKLKYLDVIVYKFLNNLFKENLLKDTSVFLLSDHGTSMPSLYYLYNFYKYEKHLPMLYLLINDRKNISYNQQYKYLNKNQQAFITGYDIYNTIGNLVYGNNYKSIKYKNKKKDTPKTNMGKSLFTNINQKNRTPKKYKEMVQYICE